MRRKNSSLLICFALTLAIAAPLKADRLLLSQGSPLLVVGTGIQLEGTFENTSSDWAILSNSALLESTQGASSYTDFVGSRFTVVDPKFNFKVILGNYQFAPSVNQNFQIAGATLSLYYELFSVSANAPNFDPLADYVSSDEVSVDNVTFIDEQNNAGPPLQAPAPEPTSWTLLGVGAIFLLVGLRRKQTASLFE